jgi:hypothetical protein
MHDSFVLPSALYNANLEKIFIKNTLKDVWIITKQLFVLNFLVAVNGPVRIFATTIYFYIHISIILFLNLLLCGILVSQLRHLAVMSTNISSPADRYTVNTLQERVRWSAEVHPGSHQQQQGRRSFRVRTIWRFLWIEKYFVQQLVYYIQPWLIKNGGNLKRNAV